MDPDQGGPKYLNSPETPIYSKSRTLYGLNLTKAQIRKVGFAVLVEGYFDFAQVFQSQAAPAVASCGTALTPQQAQLLRRFTSKIVLSFDPDAAGQGAAVRSCELLVAEGFDVNVVVLDKGEDPDTFIRRKGGDQYADAADVVAAVSRIPAGSGGRRAWISATTTAGGSFSGKMLTVAARIPDADRPGPVRGPDRPQSDGLRKRWCGRKSGKLAVNRQTDRHDPRAALVRAAETRRKQH